uniref:MAM domain-containing protein n=1 Tax=Globodera pallida TaxID=36090 RepID=A0A183CD36_GLOPA
MDSLRKSLLLSSALNHTRDAPGNAPPTASFVARILQVALGLFVTTSELPQLTPDLRSDASVGFDCDFSLPCRWNSVGGTADRWKMARGEPDSILWLAATGTMVHPTEPFALLEVRDGRLADMLGSELVSCQEGSSLFSFTYWSVGASDLEICLLGADYRRLNCTGMLQTSVQPGKVALKVPPVKQSFHIAIIPSRSQGILVVDNIKYDAKHCGADSTSPMPLWTLGSTLPSGPEWPPFSSVPMPTSSPPVPMPTSSPPVPMPTSSPPVPMWRSSSTTATTSTSSPVFISPTPVTASGPHSTSLPLPNPFSLGPALPMGPLILPPLLPGPPSGIINPFVVAPLIPSTTASSFAPWTSVTPIPPIASSPMTHSPTTDDLPTAAPTHIPPFVVPTTDFGTATVRPPPVGPPNLASLFTSTLISSRARPNAFTRHSATVPWETGIPNILIRSTTTTVKPLPSFDLLIVGAKTRPFFDRRLGRITEQTDDLLCDFTHNFPCLWGPESGRWAIVHKGAIPSLDEESESDEEELPQYPAAVVIQGTAMLTSDPLRCQSGTGKLLFRYWTNGRVLVQVCAIGWAVDSPKIQCVEEVAQHNRLDPNSLAVFELSDAIREPFTLNVVPVWEKNSHNTYLMIDEIAYIGECNLTALNELEAEEEQKDLNDKKGGSKGSSSAPTNIPFTEQTVVPTRPRTLPTSSRRPPPSMIPPSIVLSTFHPNLQTNLSSTTFTILPPPVTVLPVLTSTATATHETSFWKSSKPGTRYPFLTNPPKPPPPRYPSSSTKETPQITADPLDLIMTSTRRRKTTDLSSGEDGAEVFTIYPGIAPLDKKKTKATSTKGSFTIPYTTTQKYGTTQPPPYEQNFCKLLNCDFNENACHYLNHGLTKVPWTLRTKGYGFPLNRHTDLRPASTNGQFVSTVLGPGDFAILESPRFNLTEGINFYLVAHNLDRSAEKTAIAIDNIRVAICDPRAIFDPEDPDYVELAGGERVTVPATRAPPGRDSNELYADESAV